MLEDLHDCAINDLVRDEFSGLNGFKTSLLRSSRAEKLLKEAKVIFTNQIQFKKIITTCHLNTKPNFTTQEIQL